MGNCTQNPFTSLKTEQQPTNEVSEFAIKAAEDLFNRYTNSEIREFLEELKQHCLDRLHKQLEQARDEHQRLDDDFGNLQREI